MTYVTIKVPDGYKDADEFLKDCAFELAPQSDPQSISDELRGALEDSFKLNEHIAGHYILSLSDFRYLNNVSTQIKNALALPGAPV